MDELRRSLLRDLERALLDAIAESPEVHRTLTRMHREGFTLQVLLECQPAGVAPLPAGEPTFRIDSQDLAFLRSVGIDPTRKRRGHRAD